MPVKGRIAQALLTLDEKFGKTENGFLNISISRQDLASFAGTTYETAFRIVTELTNEGLIQIVDKKIILLDKARLLEQSQ